MPDHAQSTPTAPLSTPPTVPSSIPPVASTAPPAPPLPPPPPPLPPGELPILPPGWEDTTGFRETFLVLLEPEEVDAYRAVGWHLHDLLCERGRRQTPESFLRTLLRAILADLRHLEGLLAHVARERTASELTPEDDALAAQAALRALQLRQLAEALAGDLGPPPPLSADPLPR